MQPSSLNVFYEDYLVGVIEEFEEEFVFTYDSSWLNRPDSFAISISMPLTEKSYFGGIARNFFANLLPEERLRSQLARSLGISEDNIFAMLHAVGGECAGAFVITTQGRGDPSFTYESVTLDDLITKGENFAIGTDLVQGKTRLSLAGAQSKIPVLCEGRNILLPLDNSPSSHIVKFENQLYANLPFNEVFMTMLAKNSQLTVVDIALLSSKKGCVSITRRYDRIEEGPRKIRRLHQEDFCQALGLSNLRKYEAEGGPTFAQCLELVRKHSVDPLEDSMALMRWFAFNWAVGNADAHGKNLSFVLTKKGRRLAPFYDFVCTHAYGKIDRKFAMTVAGEAIPEKITREHWKKFSEQIDVKANFLLNLVGETLETTEESVSSTVKQFDEAYGKKQVLEPIVKTVQKQLRRARQLI